MEQVTVTMFKAKDGSMHQNASDATAVDRAIERTNRLKGIIGSVRGELDNFFRYGLLTDGGNQTRRAQIITKLGELIEDNFDKIAKARMDANKVPSTVE
jgi:hypothetical protein